MKLIQDIPGAICELGVCSGNGLISLIHCHNILEPTKAALKGYIIAFDELNWKSFPGETIAALE